MARKKLLVVENDPQTLWLLYAALSEHFEIHAANGGPDAIQHLRETQPDAVLLDASGNSAPGDGFLDLLRSCHESLRSVPLFIMAAGRMDSGILGGLNIMKCLKKPRDCRSLVPSLAAVVGA